VKLLGLVCLGCWVEFQLEANGDYRSSIYQAFLYRQDIRRCVLRSARISTSVFLFCRGPLFVFRLHHKAISLENNFKGIPFTEKRVTNCATLHLTCAATWKCTFRASVGFVGVYCTPTSGVGRPLELTCLDAHESDRTIGCRLQGLQHQATEMPSITL
jgi:hypothetical protein